MVLFGIGQIGCSPNELATRSEDGVTCVEDINSANQIFNSKLKGLVDQFNNQLPDSKVIYINSYGIFQDIISNPSAYGNLISILNIFLVTFLQNQITYEHVTFLTMTSI